jgi:hypothetical protein
METIDRFFEKRETPSHLTFNKKFGDVVMLDGKYQLITGFGAYNNQMWTEKIFEDGCHLGAGNYENIERAVIITDNNIRNLVIDAYKKELSENYYRYLSKEIGEDKLNSHLSQFS